MSTPELTLHFREGCHLCEDMEQQLYELLEPNSFTLTKVDIDLDPELRGAYNDRVPVLSFNQMDICEHFLDLQALKETLANA